MDAAFVHVVGAVLGADLTIPIAGGGIFTALVSFMGYTIHLNLKTQDRSDRLADADHSRLLKENTLLREENRRVAQERDDWRDRYLKELGAK